MLGLKTIFALVVGKLIQIFCRVSGLSSGTALPGYIALKIDPDFLSNSAAKLGNRPIIITGTNGKTTTTRLIETILTTANLKIISNRTGSNLKRGVASAMIEHLPFSSVNQNLIPIWEIDEAVLAKVTPILDPQIVVITNIFRDQLDRYGEINTLLNEWKKALDTLPTDTWIILNGDDPNITSLVTKDRKNTIRFGSDPAARGSSVLPHAAESHQCPQCGKELKPEKIFTAHYGRYYCLSCKFTSYDLSTKIQDVKMVKHRLTKTVSLTLVTPVDKLKLSIPLLGRYNLYNLAAAVSAAQILNIDSNIIKQAVKSFSPAFGRGELIVANGQKIKLLLAKNPIGLNEIITTLHQPPSKQMFLLVLNDEVADGRDVSWIWDADFEKLVTLIKHVVVSGTRAQDLALRLKYAGLDPSHLIIEVKLEEALKAALQNTNDRTLKVISTYTATLQLRRILNRWGATHPMWKD